MDEDKRRQELLAALDLWGRIRDSSHGRALNDALLRQVCGVVEEWIRCDPKDHFKMVALRAEATTLISLLNHEYGLWKLVVASTPPEQDTVNIPAPLNWVGKLLRFFGLGKGG